MWFLVCFLITLATFWYKSNACSISLVTMFVLKPNLENRIQIIYAIVWIDMFKKLSTNHSYWSSAIGFAIFELLSSNVISCSGSCNVSINISIDWYLISLFTFPFLCDRTPSPVSSDEFRNGTQLRGGQRQKHPG